MSLPQAIHKLKLACVCVCVCLAPHLLQAWLRDAQSVFEVQSDLEIATSSHKTS